MNHKMKKDDKIIELRAHDAHIIAEVASSLKKFTAKDAMIRPVTVHINDSCSKIKSKLKKEDVDVCIVIDDDKHLVGEVSIRDILKYFMIEVLNEPLTKKLNIGYSREILRSTAGNLINTHQVKAYLDTPINEVIELIIREGYVYIPIVDTHEKLLGVVTPSSVLRLLEKA